MRRELAYLDDILECIARIEEYLTGIDETTFQTNRLLQDGVTRNLEIIGEAAKCLPDEVKQKQPQIDWRNITRMRDKLTHHYFRLDLHIIWVVATQDLAPLKTAVSVLLKELEP
jgi:uncharacterized protein with HEPN domain